MNYEELIDMLDEYIDNTYKERAKHNEPDQILSRVFESGEIHACKLIKKFIEDVMKEERE